MSENLESWLAWREAAERLVPGYVEDELRGYLECGILCFGFAIVAFSCKGRGVCPSCKGRHMAQTAAYLADHVIPPLPGRQWVISVPNRSRGMLADRPRAVAALTKIFLAEIERLLLTASGITPGADTLRATCPRLGGISFLHRFGSVLNHHVHLHACVTDGVFVPAADPKLMARVGEEVPLDCPACGGDIRLIAFITQPGNTRKILTHLGEPLEPPPVSPARGPPTDWAEFVHFHDDRDIFQASPDELPAIDIHSL